MVKAPREAQQIKAEVKVNKSKTHHRECAAKMNSHIYIYIYI